MNNDTKNIENLLEKYFEGMTSLEDETFLRKYFQQNKLPETLQVYKPIFTFFSREVEEEAPANPGASLPQLTTETKQHSSKVKKEKLRNRFFLISSGIAAGIVLLVGIRYVTNSVDTSRSFAYIDGKKYMDIRTVRQEALNALENLSDGNEDAFAAQIDILTDFTENKNIQYETIR